MLELVLSIGVNGHSRVAFNHKTYHYSNTVEKTLTDYLFQHYHCYGLVPQLYHVEVPDAELDSLVKFLETL